MEILQYKNRDSSIPKRETKENVPDGSQRQAKKLSDVCQRQEVLLREERVAKIGHIAVGEWHPEEGSVELIVERGKFWHSMGFHKADKKWLRPFEALYLLETCSLDLQFHGLTMSVQEAYDVLIPKIISLEFYQVYSYLMRLGYIIEEHTGNTAIESTRERVCHERTDDTTEAPMESSNGERVCNETTVETSKDTIDSSSERVFLQSTVGVSEVPIDISSEMICHERTVDTREAPMESSSERVCHVRTVKTSEDIIDSLNERVCSEGTVDTSEAEHELEKKIPEPRKGSPLTSPTQKTISKSGDSLKHTKLKREHDQLNTDRLLLPEKKVKMNLDYTTWNFKEIYLPNIMETVDARVMPIQQVCLDEILLPQMLVQKEQLSDDGVEEEMRSSRLFWHPELASSDIATEANLLSNNDSPRNWCEYKLMKKQADDLTPLHQSPMRHIWEGEVQPLIKPSDALTTSNLMCKLQTIKKANFTSHYTESCEQQATEAKIHFNIYLPESNYKKSAPGKPIIYVVVAKLEDEPPSLSSQLKLLAEVEGTPLVWAVVDNGDISFYTLRDVQLPPGIDT